ncbi:MAG TPA: hypothetical protein VM487_22505 [Phycisphaerae bacterium]|nr:hypothetical protein [Phycisphaerae bacterium]
MGSFRLHRAFLFTLTGSLVIAAGMGLFGLAVEFRFGRLGDRALQTALSVALFSLTSFGCAIAWERDRWRVVAVIGIVCSVLSIPVYMLGIWIRWGGPYWEPIFKTMAMMATWCVLLAHMCLLTLARPKRGWRWTVRWTRVCAVLLGLGISAMIIIDPGYPTGEVCARVLGGLAILTACGTVCVPILHKLGAIPAGEELVTTPLTLTITCPRCTQSQQVTAGRSRCRSCGLKFRIEIEEAVCIKCGYALYMLTSDRCPECGTPIAPDQANGATTESGTQA